MKRNVINLPAILISGLALVLCAGGFYGLHQWQLSRIATGLLGHSEVAEGKLDWFKSAEYLDRYLRIKPTDARARGRLALAYGKGASKPEDYRTVVQLCYRALGAGYAADEKTLRTQLADSLIKVGRYLEAEHEAEKLLQLDPADAAAQRALALALFSQLKTGSLAAERIENLQLIATVEKAAAANPQDVDLAEIAAAVFREHADVVRIEFPDLNEAERLSRGDDHLDSLIQNSPKAAAYLARYRYRSRNSLAGSNDDLQQALSLEPKNPDVLLTAAFANLEAGQTAAAQGDQTRANEKFAAAKEHFATLHREKLLDKNSDVLVGLGDACQRSADLDGALKVWREGLRNFTNPFVQVTLHSRIADALIAADRDREAAESLTEIDNILSRAGRDINKDSQLSLLQSQDLRQGSLAIKRGQFQEAIQYLQRALTRQTIDKRSREVEFYAWNQLGRSFAALDDWIEAGIAFDRATAIQPQALPIRLAAAQAWFNAGRPELAFERAEPVVKANGAFEAWMIVATAQYQIQVALANSERDWKRLEEALKALGKSPADAPMVWRVPLLEADYLAFRGRVDGNVEDGRQRAKAVLDAAAAKHTADVEFMKRSSVAYESLGYAAAADSVIEQMRTQKLPAVDIALAEARLLMERKDFPGAKGVLEAASRKVATPDQAKLRDGLLSVADAADDIPQLERLLQSQLAERPNELRLLRQRCELALEHKDFPGVSQWSARLSAAGPMGKLWAEYYQAMRLLMTARDARDSNLPKALAIQEAIAAARPNWPRSFILRGMIKERIEQWEEAATAYESAIQLGVSQPSVYERLIAILERLNRSAEADKYLSRLESYLPFSQQLTEYASEHQFRSNPKRAIDIARAAVKQRPDDPHARVWLGRVLLLNKDLVESEQEFKRAVEISNDIRAWNGLFSFYLRTGATEKARTTLTEIAAKAKLADSDRDFVVAQGLEALGDFEQAAAKFRTAADRSPKNAVIQLRLAGVYLRTDPTQAVTCLRKSLELDPQLAPARRMLAAILGSRGTEAEMKEAEELLTSAGAPNTAVAVEDRRLRALLLASRGSGENTARAIQLLEEIVSRESTSLPGDQVILAQLYEHESRMITSADNAAARLKNARQQLLTLAAREAPQPNHLIALVEFLLRQNQVAEAAPWIEKLELMIPESNPDAVLMSRVVELWLRQGTIEKCNRWIDRIAAQNPDPLKLAMLRSKLLAKKENPEAAAAFLEPIALGMMEKLSQASEQIPIAKEVGDFYAANGLHANSEQWYRRLAALDAKQFPLVVTSLARQKRAKDAILACIEQDKIDRSSRYAIVASTILADLAPPADVQLLAEPLLQNALKNSPEDVGLLYSVGTLYVAQGKYEPSIATFRKILTINPRHVPALNNLALVLAESPSKRREALELIEQAINVVGSHPGLLDTKGAILVYDGKSEEALPLLEFAARGEQVDPRHNLHLAAAYRDTAKTELARANLKLALDRELESLILTQSDKNLLENLRSKLGL